MIKLASSNQLEDLKSLVAEFYVTSVDNIDFEPRAKNEWSVKVRGKTVSTFIVKRGKRYVFGFYSQVL